MFLSRLAPRVRRSFFSPLFAALLLCLPLLVAGCGGGGGDDDNDDITRIADILDTGDFYDSNGDFYYDIYIVRARRSGDVTINAFSNEFDVFLGAEEETGDDVNEFDDNGGGGLNSRIDFNVDADQEIAVGVGSADGGLGRYELLLSDRLELISSTRVRARDLSPEMLKQLKTIRDSKKNAMATMAPVAEASTPANP